MARSSLTVRVPIGWPPVRLALSCDDEVRAPEDADDSPESIEIESENAESLSGLSVRPSPRAPAMITQRTTDHIEIGEMSDSRHSKRG